MHSMVPTVVTPNIEATKIVLNVQKLSDSIVMRRKAVSREEFRDTGRSGGRPLPGGAPRLSGCAGSSNVKSVP